MRRVRIILSALNLALGVLQITAGEPAPKVGSHAPKLQPGQWLQGEPVKEFENGKVYLVEFWATWCAPCRAAIPHLNEIQAKFKDRGLVVIGQDCWEGEGNAVGPLVKSMGKKMSYRIALDDTKTDSNGRVATTWMTVAGREGIPRAFLVDTQGMIVWIGDPRSLDESDLEALLINSDTFFLKRVEEDAPMEPSLAAQYWDDALVKLAEMEKRMTGIQLIALEETRIHILLRKKEVAAATQRINALSAKHPDDAMVQNFLAWEITYNRSIEKRDLILAERMARRANDLTGARSPQMLDTLARIWFLQGKTEAASEMELKAAELVQGSQKERFTRIANSYRKGELPEN